MASDLCGTFMSDLSTKGSLFAAVAAVQASKKHNQNRRKNENYPCTFSKLNNREDDDDCERDDSRDRVYRPLVSPTLLTLCLGTLSHSKSNKCESGKYT